MARPTIINDLIVKKLEEAFIVGATIEEACYYADISRQTFYNWKAENPELFDRFEELRLAPVLKARMAVCKALETNPKLAMRYLERKKRDEFGIKGVDEKKETTEIVDEIMKRFQTPPEVIKLN